MLTFGSEPNEEVKNDDGKNLHFQQFHLNAKRFLDPS